MRQEGWLLASVLWAPGCPGDCISTFGPDQVTVEFLGDTDAEGAYEIVARSDGRAVAACVVDLPLPEDAQSPVPCNDGVSFVYLDRDRLAYLETPHAGDVVGYELRLDGELLASEVFEPAYEPLVDDPNHCGPKPRGARISLDW